MCESVRVNVRVRVRVRSDPARPPPQRHCSDLYALAPGEAVEYAGWGASSPPPQIAMGMRWRIVRDHQPSIPKCDRYALPPGEAVEYAGWGWGGVGGSRSPPEIAILLMEPSDLHARRTFLRPRRPLAARPDPTGRPGYHHLQNKTLITHTHLHLNRLIYMLDERSSDLGGHWLPDPTRRADLATTTCRTKPENGSKQ